MAIAAVSHDTAAAQRPVVRAPANGVESGTSATDAAPLLDHDGQPNDIKSDMSFWDFLDIINPLQHIPIISTIYREITGDTIKPAERVMGGILYGGVIGGVTSIVNAVVEEAQGKSLDQQVIAALGFGDDGHGASDTEMAGRTNTVPGSTGDTQVAALPAAATSTIAASTATAQTVAAQTVAAQTVARASGSGPIRLFADARQAATAPAQLPTAGPLGSKVEAQLTAQRATEGVPRDALMGASQPHPSRMPARDTPLASSTMAKHIAPRFAATLPGATTASARAASLSPAALAAQTQALQAQATQAKALEAQAQSAERFPATATTGATPNPASDVPAAPVPVSPAMLPEAMMRNLQKYEQSRKSWQSSTPAMNLAS